MASVVFSSDIEEMRGTVGSRVYSRARSGATVRSQGKVSNPRTASQTQARLNFARASAAYKNLNPTQAAAWRAYAQTLTARNKKTGEDYVPSGNIVFNGLAAKFLQINPGGVIPLSPPSTGFAGDGIHVTASGDDHNVIFTASGANGTHIKTELLLQPLISANRMPSEGAYRTQEFVAFAAGSLDATLALPNGWYAPAYKFVNTLTGQESFLVPLPPVEVA